MSETETRRARGKRRHRTKQERRRIVEESLAAEASVAAVAAAHSVRTSQIYHWRKLYAQGRLGAEDAAAALVPVRIIEADRVESSAQRGAGGSILIQFERAYVRVEGVADAATLRVVLECLRA